MIRKRDKVDKEHDPLPLAKKVALGTAASGLLLGLAPLIYGIGMYGACRWIEHVEKKSKGRENDSEKK